MTAKRPIGVSVIPDTFSDLEWDWYLTRVEHLKPSGAIVIGHTQRALELKSVCADDAEVIFRGYDPFNDRPKYFTFDNQFHQIHRDPFLVLDNLERTMGNLLDKFTWSWGLNEPSHN